MLKNLFSNKNNKQIAFKNSFWLFAGEGIIRITKLIVFVYAARILGVANWGSFSYILALITMGAMLSDIGLNVLFIREIAKKKEVAKTYASTALVVKSILLLLAILGVSILYYFSDSAHFASYGILIGVIILADGLRDFYTTLIRGFEKMEYEALIKTIFGILFAITTAVALIFYRSIGSLLWAYVVASSIATIISTFLLKKQVVIALSHFKKYLVREILVSAWPIASISIFSALLLNIDTIFLKWLHGETAVGYYSAAQRPVQLLFMIPNLIASALLPIFTRIYIQTPERFSSIVSKTVSGMIMVGLPIIVLGNIFSSQIITTLFGALFTPAVVPFQLLLALVFVVFPGAIITNALLATDKQKAIVPAIFFGIIINVCCSLVLIPRLGAIGASWAALLAQIATYGAIAYALVKQTTLRIKSNVLHASIAGVIVLTAGKILSTTSLPVAVTGALVLLVYTLTLYILKNELLQDLKTTIASIFYKIETQPAVEIEEQE
jgi:O-antigen/teichoic acid export membrane protein